MRLDTLVGRFQRGRFWLDSNSNKVRLSVLSMLIGVTSVALALSTLTSCKSSAKNHSNDSASASITPADNKPGENPASVMSAATPTQAGSSSESSASPSSELALSTPGVVMPGSPLDPALDMEAVGEKQIVGGPVAGLEAWQDDKPVKTIVTGKQVLFKLTPWTRDTASADGCQVNPGIVQASWTVGSKPAADVQRLAGQDCRTLDYSGMFTKEGSITIKLDVLSVDGEVASAVETFPVTAVQ